MLGLRLLGGIVYVKVMGFKLSQRPVHVWGSLDVQVFACFTPSACPAVSLVVVEEISVSIDPPRIRLASRVGRSPGVGRGEGGEGGRNLKHDRPPTPTLCQP